MFSQESDFNSQTYHTSVSQRFSAPNLFASTADLLQQHQNLNNNNNNNNDADIAVLTDRFAKMAIEASVAMGGEEIDRQSRVNASQIINSTQQQQKNIPSSSSSAVTPFERALLRYCDGTWHTQQYLSVATAEERRRHAQLAAQSFQQSIDADHHFAYAHYGAGLMSLLEKNYEGAFSNTRQALLKMGSHCPNMVRFVLGIAALQLDYLSIAEKCFVRITAVSESADALGHIGTLLVSIRRRDIIGIAESLLNLQGTIPHLPIELIQKSADMIYLQCWPTPGSQSPQDQFNPNLIRQRISEVAPALLRVIEQSRSHPSCTPALAAYADFQEGRLRAALAVQADSDTAAGRVDKEEMTVAQRLLYRASQQVIPAIPHLVRATFHSHGHEAALIQALQGFNRMAKLGLVPFRELFEMTTVLLTLNHQPEAAVRMAKQLVDTIGLANSEAWFNASFVNRLDNKTAHEQAKQAVIIEDTVKNGAAAAGTSMMCTSGEDETRVSVNLAALAPQLDHRGPADPADPVNILLKNAAQNGIDLEQMSSASYNSTGVAKTPSTEMLPLIFNFGLLQESRGNRQEAVRIYVALIKWFPHEQSPYFRLATIALDNGDVWTCIKWMQLCITISKDEFKAQCFSMMARALSTAGTAGNATAYKLLTGDEGKAVLEASGPQQQAILYACAGACLAHDAQGGQHIQMKAGAALRLFRQALKLDPNSSAASHGIACCVALLGASEHSSAILERITSERCPDTGITKFAAENLFNAYVNTSAHRQALRLEQIRKETYPDAPVTRDRANAIICALLLTNRTQEAVDRARELAGKYPRHALTNFTAVLVAMGHVLSSVESMSLPKTEAAAAAMTALIDDAVRWAGLATQLKDKPEATDFVRRLISYTKKLDLRQVIHRFVQRTQQETAEYAGWRDEWRAENTQRTRDAEEHARRAREQRQLDQSQTMLQGDGGAEAANNNFLLDGEDPDDPQVQQRQQERFRQYQTSQFQLYDQQRTMALRQTLGGGPAILFAQQDDDGGYDEAQLQQMQGNNYRFPNDDDSNNRDDEIPDGWDVGPRMSRNNGNDNNNNSDDIRRREREEDTNDVDGENPQQQGEENEMLEDELNDLLAATGEEKQ